jgi:hypothetical protein
LLSRAWLRNQHRGRGEIARAWLEENGATEGLIALSGAAGGDVGQALLGDHAEAAELLAELTGGWRKMAVFASASWVGKAAHAAALTGPAPAEALRAPLAELDYRTPWAEAAIRTVTGATARAAGDPAEAGRQFLAAADLYASIPVMTDRALALALAAAAFTAAGRPDQAGPALAEVTAFAARNAALGLLRVANG